MSDSESNVESDILFDSDDDFTDDDIIDDNISESENNKKKLKKNNKENENLDEEIETESTIYGAGTETNDDCIYDFLDDDEEVVSKMIRVPDDERMTTKKLTKYERVRILGIRTKQISMGAKVMLKYEGIDKTPEDLARLEIEYKVCPILIKRVLPNNKYEIWKLSELDIMN
jgi:DNA-directed RNA polymerase I, II, and III subunit RPABC2